MGKSFSCLSCKTYDNSRGKCGRKRQLVKHQCEPKQETSADPVHEILKENRQEEIWKLKDVDDGVYGAAVQPFTSQHASPEMTEEDDEESSSLDVTERLNDVDTEYAEAKLSRQETPTMGRFRNSPSPGRNFKKSDSIPLSLRQANDEYTQRLRKQRQLTLNLIRLQKSPSPRRTTNHDTETTEDGDKLDTDYSKGDFPQHSVNNTNTELAENTIDDDKEDKELERLRELEVAFFQEFPVSDMPSTSVPSFLEVTKIDKLSEDTKEDNITTEALRQLEDAFFREFPVDAEELTPVPTFLNEAKFNPTSDIEDKVAIEIASCFERHDKEAFSDEEVGICDSNDAMIEMNNALCFTADHMGNTEVERRNFDRLIITEEDIEENENGSSGAESESPDSSDDLFYELEDAVVSGGINDDTDERLAILRLAQEILQNQKPSEKQRKRLMRNHKKHAIITTCIAENTKGENYAEITDICVGILELCLNEINFDVNGNRRSQGDIDGRLRNSIHKGKMKEETYERLPHYGKPLNPDAHVRNDHKFRLYESDSNYRQQCDQIMFNITRRDVIYAIDSDGISHPIVRGSGVIAIDYNGIGYPICNRTIR